MRIFIDTADIDEIRIDAAKAGADIATVPFKVLETAAKHPLTDKGIESFLKDWETFQRR